ncbi:hypothetical protein O181_034521 [Austropuccinia psidii MF-1]|uniref:Uncharacterized protein n=1 Tax=Austropuccinia psidii MF-1 TaxID=1389203 RepID=A0A9Q3D0V4_9BASI|nr:hypothetical protein [Austropuccinia psidii MF-1]
MLQLPQDMPPSPHVQRRPNLHQMRREALTPNMQQHILHPLHQMVHMMHQQQQATEWHCRKVHYLPDNNNLLSWVTINKIHPMVPKITLLLLYNTPAKFDGLPLLQAWLNNILRRDIPSFIMTNSNWHHRLWNSPHFEAKYLNKMCWKKGFTLISPKQVPAGHPITIDLTWPNHITRHLHPET